jgi:hypothetical protein
MHDAAYILPIRSRTIDAIDELTGYLRWLDERIHVIVVDGSAEEVFDYHDRAWEGIAHVPVASSFRCANGKVAGVLTGVAMASDERLVIADEDVRYDDASLQRVVAQLDEGAVVRPQNYFQPMPWHAKWDGARSLVNRVLGGDWPGTLAVRRSVLLLAGGYNGDCLFENLELVRTIRAAGGREVVASDVFVARRPPNTRYFLSQRVRQAYDEFARPGRLLWQLALLPVTVAIALKRPRLLPILGAISIGIAEMGRRRKGASAVFPPTTALFAPAWLAERAVCSWLALTSRVIHGGVTYHGRVIATAATSSRKLEQRVAEAVGPT